MLLAPQGGNVLRDQTGFGGTYGSATSVGNAVRVRSTNGAMLNKVALPLNTSGATSVTFSFDEKVNTVEYRHLVEFSNNIGFLNTGTTSGINNIVTLLDTIFVPTGGTLNLWQSRTYTVDNNVGGVVFTDNCYFRIRKQYPNVTGAAGSNSIYHVYDNLLITAEVPPTLASTAIVDDKSGGTVAPNTLVTYTVTFSEDMDDSTVTAADFGNAGTSTVTIGAVTETTPTSGIFTVEATPTNAGTLQLQVIPGADVKDAAGLSMLTTPIDDNTSIIVDGTLPTLIGTDIVDDQSGGPVESGTLVTYTVTFSEDMNASTVDASDFGNSGTATVTIGTVTENSPGVFTVEATPTSAGTLQLRVNADAVLTDFAGNALDSNPAIDDDTTITVTPDTTPPTLLGVDIVADQGTGPVGVNTEVIYTLFFSEDMDESTMDASDFSNAGTSTISIGAVTEDAESPGVLTVVVTPTSTGTLRLQVKANAVLKDVAGNNLDTNPAIPADVTIPVGLVTNGGFENPGDLGNGFFASFASGWSQGTYDVSDPGVWVLDDNVPADYIGVWDPDAAGYTSEAAPEGLNIGFTTTVPGFDIGFSQVLSSTLQASTQYVLSVKVSNPSIYNEGLTADYRIELLAGGVLLQSTTGASPIDDSTVITASLTYNSGAAPAQLGEALEIRLVAVDDGSDGYEVDFDDVQFTITPGGSPYTTWTGGPFLAPLTTTSAALDFDCGGLATGIEWVVGGDPTDGSDDAGLAPGFDNTDANFFIFTYTRTDAAHNDANTSITVEYGSDLNGWTPAVHDGTNIFIIPTDNGATDSVEVKIKRTLAVGDSLFARLKVVVSP